MYFGSVGRGMAFCAVAIVCAGAAMAQDLRPQARPGDLAVPDDLIPVAVIASPAPLADIAPPPEAVVAPPAPASFTAPTVGPETNLPLPRFVSLKTDRGNVRRGPSLSHRIDWVFLRRGMPLQVVAEYGHWRRVVDREGIGGWINYALISGHRTVLVDADALMVRTRADLTSPEVAQFERGVIAGLEECAVAFCYISAGGYGGWAPKEALWGVGADEILD